MCDPETPISFKLGLGIWEKDEVCPECFAVLQTELSSPPPGSPTTRSMSSIINKVRDTRIASSRPV